MPPFLDYLLLFAIGFLFFTTLILLYNRRALVPLPEGTPANDSEISILIPARDEEFNIRQAVSSACLQDADRYEVIVYDDASTDRTPQLLRELKNRFPDRLTLMRGEGKPEGWIGKSHACYRLSEAARGEILLFIDADVTLRPDVVRRTRLAFDESGIGMITVWPRQIVKTFWEQVLIPMVYHGLTTLLPSGLVRRTPEWLPGPLKAWSRKAFAAACGQFIAIRREVYRETGGHSSIKGHVVEDVALARLARTHGYGLRMYEGSRSVLCRMYRNLPEIHLGFRKNFFAGFNYRWSLFIGSGILHLSTHLIPFITLVASLFLMSPTTLFLSAIAVSLILIQRLVLARWFGWNPLYSWTHPVAMAWFQWLGVAVMIDRITGKEARWKGRSV